MPQLIGKNSYQYSMRIRTIPQYTSQKIVPGPGQYSIPTSISANGRYACAKYKSNGCTFIGPPTSARFKGLSIY